MTGSIYFGSDSGTTLARTLVPVAIPEYCSLSAGSDSKMILESLGVSGLITEKR